MSEPVVLRFETAVAAATEERAREIMAELTDYSDLDELNEGEEIASWEIEEAA